MILIHLIFAVNRLPMFTQNISVINVTLGETFILELEADDPDDDDLTFEAPILPPGANFTVTSGNRLIFYWPVQSAESVCIQYSVYIAIAHTPHKYTLSKPVSPHNMSDVHDSTLAYLNSLLGRYFCGILSAVLA